MLKSQCSIFALVHSVVVMHLFENGTTTSQMFCKSCVTFNTQMNSYE